MFCDDQMKKKVYIHIGELHASKNPVIIHTLVGSCVAVCLYDPVNHIGGMNHILLPGRADLRHFDAPARYGINAIELLINKIMKLGGDRKQLVAKVFGGAHIISAISRENGIGKKNADFVIEFLRNESIRIVNSDLEGNSSRRIYFHTDTGQVFLKKVKPIMSQQLVLQEHKLILQTKKLLKTVGKIELFLNNGNRKSDHQ